ncbi:amidohydrolase [Corynebacterium sp.]|uniref:amidohydrolase n=1 Tax=Corynebacterium sp. TaxID=1720 RepID=UPI002A917D19|nr:amidohydrolase [Corynebacterium sp.]MDY5785267.1 amidohydrolase [Corynebacterium sp.]
MPNRDHIFSSYESVKDAQEQLYYELHRHPELSMQEERTRGVIVEKLADAGYAVVEIGGGVVGVLENGDGPTVMLRADFDGLPVKEETGLDYASTATAIDANGDLVPVMHACGHDVHVASLIAMAEMMAANKDSWSGTLELLFQPGEEIAAGAKAMVDDGIVDAIPRPDVAFGQHVMCGLAPAGHVAVISGKSFSTSVNVFITLYGQGSHGSMPHLSIDPVVLASSVVQRLQTIVARELSPHEFGVVTVGTIRAGSRPNVIPETAHLGLNVRAYDEAVRDKTIESIRRIVEGECAASGSPREPDFEFSGVYPLVDNDAEVTERIKDAFIDAFGGDRVHTPGPATGSEDFPYIPDAFGTPYCYWAFSGAPEGMEIPNHSSKFAPVVQPTLETGAKALVAAACAYLK